MCSQHKGRPRPTGCMHGKEICKQNNQTSEVEGPKFSTRAHGGQTEGARSNPRHVYSKGPQVETDGKDQMLLRLESCGQIKFTIVTLMDRESNRGRAGAWLTCCSWSRMQTLAPLLQEDVKDHFLRRPCSPISRLS